MVAVAAALTACDSPDGITQPLPSPTSVASNTVVSCTPVLRFRLGDIEYENRRFDDVVAVGDLGPVVGEVSVYPAALDRCEPVVLQDGEGSLTPGTEIHEIVGVDPSTALTASLGNDVYLVYIGRPVA